MGGDEPQDAKRDEARAVGVRLAQALAEAKYTQNKFESVLRLPSGYVNKLTKGILGQRVEPSKFFAIPEMLGVNPKWLWLGEGPMRGEGTVVGPNSPPRTIAREMAFLMGIPANVTDYVLERFAGVEWDAEGPGWFFKLIEDEAYKRGVSRRDEIRRTGDEKRRRDEAPPPPASAKPERKRRTAGKR